MSEKAQEGCDGADGGANGSQVAGELLTRLTARLANSRISCKCIASRDLSRGSDETSPEEEGKVETSQEKEEEIFSPYVGVLRDD